MTLIIVKKEIWNETSSQVNILNQGDYSVSYPVLYLNFLSIKGVHVETEK